jgi:hypothetical protein
VVKQDIESVDPVFYKSLRSILDSPIDDLCLGLTFSADRDEFGVRKTVRVSVVAVVVGFG